ncbi:uncharacterized protein [Parasteatoda tepidariorum]
MIPSSASETLCQWLYPITFGGGLVEGDSITINLIVSEKCCLLVTSLSFPKVYRCENNIESQQFLKCDVEADALLCVLPDPLVCYEKALYLQTQTFHLADDANLVLLDWFTSGRYERGERWQFSRLKTVSTIYINGQLSFREAQDIRNTPLVSIESSMKAYNIIGTCMIIGPGLNSLSSCILSSIGRCNSYGEKSCKNILISASPLCLNETSKPCGCIVRFASESVSDAIKKIEEILQPLYEIIGDNPFIKK